MSSPRQAKNTTLLSDALKLCITRPSTLHADKSISVEIAAIRRLAEINSIVETALCEERPSA